MLGPWLEDIESLETIAQDADTRDLFLRMAGLSAAGSLRPFLRSLADDLELGAAERARFAELAADAAFLHAVEDYVHRTRMLH
ncbi:MAG: hypothetical protein ACRDLK_05645 [Gaiellaceae bacterium]